MSEYFTLEGVASDQYLKFPKIFLNQDSKYSGMKPMSKLLYMVLFDRNNLSIMNGWVDEKNRVYFLFIHEEICKAIVIKVAVRKSVV